MVPFFSFAFLTLPLESAIKIPSFSSQGFPKKCSTPPRSKSRGFFVDCVYEGNEKLQKMQQMPDCVIQTESDEKMHFRALKSWDRNNP